MIFFVSTNRYSGELEVLLSPGKYAVASTGVVRELKGIKVTTNNVKKVI